MLLRGEKIVAVYYENYREQTNAQCGKDAVFLSVKAYSYT
jgi:hypothetical protein